MRVLRSFLIVFSLLMISLQAHAQTEFPPSFQPVIDIFTGLSDGDKEKVKNSVTEDFILLEQGEVWDLAITLSIVKGPIPRTNGFNIISSDIHGDLALYNYWTQSKIGDGENRKVVTWLESVVVIKTDDGWKLQQFHSTRVPAEKVPADLIVTEAR
ncbi:hypothetical protein [Thalassotalea mangrovi]|uniref:Nuclear transport factor 2 family protein n=1 Tax=Thalassotalea mangrovi TaxID=2572245 RepID=A0A4U1B1J0_9GAMM|nr:hypothetical protein [Thalassotalea mangrovi]TKB43256.1 hypothetical protein E8M12_15440 [Thalassotalea mangrovi]